MKYANKIANDVYFAFKEVYSNYLYLAITILFAILSFSFNVVVNNIPLLAYDFSFKLLFSIIIGSFFIYGFRTISMLILISFLGGITISMGIYILKRQFSTGLAGSSSGILISLFAPTCPSCALGLVSVLGLGGFISFLPFKGLELGIIGLLALLFSIFYLSNKICGVCEISYSKGHY